MDQDRDLLTSHDPPSGAERNHMNIPGVRGCVAICIIASIAGCATTPNQATPVLAERSSDSEEAKNRELSHGYGQLYKTASGLKHLKKLLLLKVESAKVSMLIDD